MLQYMLLYHNLTWCQKWGSRLPLEILLLLNCACNMSTSMCNMSKFQSGRRQNYRQLPFYIVLMGTLKVNMGACRHCSDEQNLKIN